MKSSTLISCRMGRRRILPGFAESKGSMWHFPCISLSMCRSGNYTYTPFDSSLFLFSDALQCHICCTLIDKFMQNPNKWKELFEFLSISFQCYSYARVQFIWLVKILIHSANLFLVSISELWCQHTPQLNFQTHFSDLIRLNCYRCALLLLLVLEKLLFTEKMS